jgi:hypothetical protein
MPLTGGLGFEKTIFSIMHHLLSGDSNSCRMRAFRGSSAGQAIRSGTDSCADHTRTSTGTCTSSCAGCHPEGRWNPQVSFNDLPDRFRPAP